MWNNCSWNGFHYIIFGFSKLQSGKRWKSFDNPFYPMQSTIRLKKAFWWSPQFRVQNMLSKLQPEHRCSVPFFPLHSYWEQIEGSGQDGESESQCVWKYCRRSYLVRYDISDSLVNVQAFCIVIKALSLDINKMMLSISIMHFVFKALST